jgi:DNA repair photolyase
MVTIIQINRKSAVLNTSSLACLSHIPTINLTSGCSHSCIYCYTRGYSSYPGESKIILYSNTLDKLKIELARKKEKPRAVYFSPSSDLFQPVPEVLELGYSVLELLFSQGIGVAFLSKGHIPDTTMLLLLNNADKVRAQIGITTLNENIQRIFEPNAASPLERVEQIAKLISGGIDTEARLDPILPGLTDDEDTLHKLFSALAKVGVKHAAVSTLFLRSGVLESLKRNIQNTELLQTLLCFFQGARRMAIHAERSSVIALPVVARNEIYQRARKIAKEYKIELSICACKNPDLAHGTCNISGAWPIPPEKDAQGALFHPEE